MAALAVMLVALAVSGCGELTFFQEREEWVFEVRNRTGQPMEVYSSGEVLWASIEADESAWIGLVGECGQRFWVARYADDETEVDRLLPPVCDGDVWVLGEP